MLQVVRENGDAKGKVNKAKKKRNNQKVKFS